MRVSVLLPLPEYGNVVGDVSSQDRARIRDGAWVDDSVATAIVEAATSPGSEERQTARFLREIGVLTVEVRSAESLARIVENVLESHPTINAREVVYHSPTYQRVLKAEKSEAGADRARTRPASKARVPGSGVVTDPDDAEPYYWNVKRVHAPAAWNAGFTGKGIRVAIVDSGVGKNCDLPRPLAAQSFIPGEDSTADEYGHGTGVASIALANGDVIGVAPEAGLIVARVVDGCGGADDEWMAAGIRWSALKYADVINMSFGTDTSPVLERAIQFAALLGSVLVAASGNSGGAVSFPASSVLCLAVGSIDQENKHIPSSSGGPELDLVAPGIDVPDSRNNNTTFPSGFGTSAAAPHVAGAAALLLSAKMINRNQVMRCLKSSAQSLGSAAKFGAGLVRPDQAIDHVLKGLCK